MAVKTYRLGAALDGVFASLFEADQTAASHGGTWTVAKVASGFASDWFVGGLSNSGSFTSPATTTPGTWFANSTSPNVAKTPAALTGTFANTAWTFTFAVRATTASAQAGRVRLRVFKSTVAQVLLADAPTELTSATVVGTTSAALSTTADVTSVATWNPGATIVLNNEYLFFCVAWEITTASGSNSGNVVPRTGQSAAGSRIVTPDFSAGAATWNSSAAVALIDTLFTFATVAAGAAAKGRRVTQSQVPVSRAAVR